MGSFSFNLSFHTPLHGLAFYGLNYPLFSLYLNNAFKYFNETCATISVLPLLQVKKFTNYIQRITIEHTLHSRVKLSIIQNLGCWFS